MSEPLLDTIANIAAGFEVGWNHLHDRIPSPAANGHRVSGTAQVSAPHRDPVVVNLYLVAQRAVRQAYHGLVRCGVAPFWISESEYRPTDLVDPLILCAVLSHIRRHLDQLDAAGREALLAAERKLKPFWRMPVQPPKCNTCKTNPKPKHRKECWTCGRRRRLRIKKQPVAR